MSPATKKAPRKSNRRLAVANAAPPPPASLNLRPGQTQSSAVGQWAPAREAMEVDFQVARSLRGGTTAMRAMGTVFLPRDAREKDPQYPLAYTERLLRTFLTPGYQDGVESLAARPFQRPVSLTEAESLPEPLRKIEENADRQGMSLTRFAQSAFDAGIDRGITHILVDMPGDRVPGDAAQVDDYAARSLDPQVVNGKVTRLRDGGEAMDQDVRPYFCLVNADNLISWAWRKDDADRDVLAFIQIYEQRDGVDPATGKKVAKDQIRLWTETEWQLWERDANVVNSASRRLSTDTDLLQEASLAGNQSRADERRPYYLVRSAPHKLGRVPLVPVVLNHYGSDRFQARPLLHACMWKNVEHWQVSSGRSSVIKFSGSPILLLTGLDREAAEAGDGTVNAKDPIVLGAGATLRSHSEKTDGKYIEFSGAASTSLKERDQELKDEMASLAMAPLMRVAGPKTATGESIDEKQTQSKAQAAVEALEWGIYEAYRLAAQWLGVELPEKFDVAIFRDFGLAARSQQDLNSIDLARARKDISRETFLREYVERGVLVTVDDIEAELERVDEEGQALADMLPMPAAPPGKPPFGGGDPNAEPQQGGAAARKAG